MFAEGHIWRDIFKGCFSARSLCAMQIVATARLDDLCLFQTFSIGMTTLVCVTLAKLSPLVLMVFLTICYVGLLQDSPPSDLVTEIGCLKCTVFFFLS